MLFEDPPRTNQFFYDWDFIALLAGLDKYREFEGPMSHVPSEIRVCGSVGVGNGRGKG